jgi:SAM-dependent methyltransferase
VREDFYADYFELEDRHWWFRGRREILTRVLERHLQPPPDGGPRRVLDVGCGTGAMVLHLERYGEAQGIDADPSAVEFCRRRGVRRVQQVTSERLPFETGSVDLVTALDVLEHVDDDTGMLREIHRVLRPGAMALVSVPAFPLLWGVQDEISHHRRRYRRRELELRTTKAGFTLEKLSHFNTLLFPPIAAIRILRRCLRLTGPKSDFEVAVPASLNAALAGLFALEAPVVERASLPFGVSLLAVGRKAGQAPG